MNNIERNLSLYFVRLSSSGFVLVDEPSDSKTNISDLINDFFSTNDKIHISLLTSVHYCFAEDSYKTFCNRLDCITSIRNLIDKCSNLPKVILHYDIKYLPNIVRLLIEYNKSLVIKTSDNI